MDIAWPVVKAGPLQRDISAATIVHPCESTSVFDTESDVYQRPVFSHPQTHMVSLNVSTSSAVTVSRYSRLMHFVDFLYFRSLYEVSRINQNAIERDLIFQASWLHV